LLDDLAGGAGIIRY